MKLLGDDPEGENAVISEERMKEMPTLALPFDDESPTRKPQTYISKNTPEAEVESKPLRYKIVGRQGLVSTATIIAGPKTPTSVSNVSDHKHYDGKNRIVNLLSMQGTDDQNGGTKTLMVPNTLDQTPEKTSGAVSGAWSMRVGSNTFILKMSKNVSPLSSAHPRVASLLAPNQQKGESDSPRSEQSVSSTISKNGSTKISADNIPPITSPESSKSLIKLPVQVPLLNKPISLNQKNVGEDSTNNVPSISSSNRKMESTKISANTIPQIHAPKPGKSLIKLPLQVAVINRHMTLNQRKSGEDSTSCLQSVSSSISKNESNKINTNTTPTIASAGGGRCYISQYESTVKVEKTIVQAEAKGEYGYLSTRDAFIMI